MDHSDDIKMRYAKEAATYREEALLVNFDFEKLFKKLLWVTNRIFTDNTVKIKVLDIGAGNGMLSELILNYYPNAEITMLDFSPEMLESASMYFEKNSINDDNIKYIIVDFITDELPNETYDLVISSYALHHIRSEDNLKELFMKIAKVLNDNIGTFICVDMYLKTGELERKRQVQRTIEKWTENFDSIDQAIQWGKIIQNEDTPATIPTIIAALYQCRTNNSDIIPLLTNQSSDMATVYGMTKLPLEEIRKRGLYDFIWAWRDNSLPIGVSKNEYKIDNLPFYESHNDSPSDIKKL